MSDIERFYWIGFNKEGKHITTMTMTDEIPKELRMPHDSYLGLSDEVYSNFIPTTKEEILKRRREFKVNNKIKQ